MIPLLVASFDAPVDLTNRAGSRTLGLTLRHQEGAGRSAIEDVSLEVSYDDGATWRPARLRAQGEGAYRTTLDRSRSGFVSLRLNASDADGNTLTQEVIRAYALR